MGTWGACLGERAAWASPSLGRPGPGTTNMMWLLLQRRQQPGHQPAALGQAIDLDMPVGRMRIGPADAEPVERGYPRRSGKIAVAAAARAAMRQTEAHDPGQPAHLFIQRQGAGIRLPYLPGGR